MTTTIQISENLRDELIKYKKSPRSSYEEVIKDLIKEYKISKEKQNNLLKEGYKAIYSKTEKINNNWEELDLEEMKNNEY